jgi:pilus assembly protein CpaE
MDIHLVTRDSALLETLAQSMRAADRRVATAICRPQNQALAPILENISHGTLLLESDEWRENEDGKALGALTQRHPRLNVVLLSHDTSKDHLLSAMRAGVREVLSCPPSLPELSATLLRFSNDQKENAASSEHAPRPGQLIAFMGCKGGIGATFLSTSMAHMVASEFDRPCIFIDMDLQYGDAAFYLGNTEHPHTVSDLAGQIERLDALLLASCMYSAAPGLRVLAAPEGIEKALAIHARHIAQVLTLARHESSLVVVDLPRSMDAASLKALDMATAIYLVVDSSMAALRDAKRLLKLFQSLGYGSEKLRLIVNKVSSSRGMDQKNLEATLGVRITHTVPAQFEEVQQCIDLGQAIGQLHPHSPVAIALRQATADLLQVAMPQSPSWLSQWFNRFSSMKTFNTAGA